MELDFRTYKESLQGQTDNKVIIIGKNRNLDEYLPLTFNDTDIIVCLNGAINLVDKCDWLVINDNDNDNYFINKELNEKGKSNIKNIFLPEFLIYPNTIPLIDNNYKKIIDNLVVDCDYVIWNAYFTAKYNPDLFNIDVVYSVADTAVAWMLYLGYRNFEFYGIGLHGGYCKMFQSDGITKTSTLKLVYNQINKLINQYNAKVKFNFSKNNNMEITKEKWQQAQIAERTYHNLSLEEGIEHYRQSYSQYFLYLEIVPDLQGKSIIEIGCADFPALNYCTNHGKCYIIEPMPSEYLDRIANKLNIDVIKLPAEEVEFPEVDEVWLMNVLQHTLDPDKIIEKCKQAAKVIRIFEPINTCVDICHLQTFELNSFIFHFGDCIKRYPPTESVVNFHTHECAYGIWKR